MELILFLFDEQKLQLHFSSAASFKGREPNVVKQTILREIKVFETLIKVLEKLNGDQLIMQRKRATKDEHSPAFSQFFECKERLFHCFLFLIKKNKRNQECLTKWVDEFINQFFDRDSRELDSPFDYQCLIRKIFKSNQALLKKRLTVTRTQEKLEKITDSQKRFEKLLEVLSFLFVVLGDNNSDKQRFISELLFSRNSEFVLNIKKDEGSKELCLESPFPEFRLVELHKYNHHLEKKLHFIEYFKVLV